MIPSFFIKLLLKSRSSRALMSSSPAVNSASFLVPLPLTSRLIFRTSLSARSFFSSWTSSSFCKLWIEKKKQRKLRYKRTSLVPKIMFVLWRSLRDYSQQISAHINQFIPRKTVRFKEMSALNDLDVGLK